jgi:elongation factor Ts
MASVSANEVQALRKRSGAGMLDCKRALEEKDGDPDKAFELLRGWGKTASAGPGGRDNPEGAVALAVSPAGAAMVELRSETDFVAMSPEFTGVLQDLAELAASEGEAALVGRASEVEKLRMSLRENIELGRVVRFEAAKGAVVGTYLHVQLERGVNAVMVELAGGTEELAHDVAVHIAFAKPLYLTREEVPAEEVAAERAVLEQITRNEGKPESALEKIVEGRLRGWFKDRVLVEQDYVRDEKQSISQLLGTARIRRFAQVVVGS